MMMMLMMMMTVMMTMMIVINDNDHGVEDADDIEDAALDDGDGCDLC